MTTAQILVLAFVLLIVGAALGYALATREVASGPLTVTGTVTVTNTSLEVNQQPLIQYCFSPNNDCAGVLVGWFERSNSSIHALIYSFTLNDVRDSLIKAKNRGVDVKIVIEKQNANQAGSEYETLKSAGLDVRSDSNPALLHDKIAIIDGHVILTGSMNWTAAADSENYENLIVLDSAQWGNAFEKEFQQIYAASS